MKHRVECPVCGNSFPVDDLNEHGLEMLKRRGPPSCMKGCRVVMREVFDFGPLKARNDGVIVLHVEWGRA